ncbi:MAG: hypothetical protein M1840_001193 [Geoglossum simile]|nr:MAG: hypothetical protein M1840_001193 [Geoglossum simile]
MGYHDVAIDLNKYWVREMRNRGQDIVLGSVAELLEQQSQLLPEQSECLMKQMVSNNEQLLAEAHAMRAIDQALPVQLPPPLPPNLSLQVKKKKGSTRKRALTGAEISERQQVALTWAQKRARVAQESQQPPSPPKRRTQAQRAAAMLAEQRELEAMEDIPAAESTTTTTANNPGSSTSSISLFDLEAQEKVTPFQHSDVGATSPTPANSDEDAGYEDNSNVPRLPLLQLFWLFFYSFGLFAYGGPVSQIALIKDRLVIRDKWITLQRFQRVLPVYQVLPGPEAAELCMFFGCLSAGKIGGIVAGIGFILPGFVLMLVASYLYTLAGFENKYFNASFRAVEPIVAAMILRAVHGISSHSMINPTTGKANPYLVIAALCTAINHALRINIFISLGLYGVIYVFIRRRLWVAAIFLFVLQYGVYALYVVFRGFPSPVSFALGIAMTPSLINLFVLGLIAGSISVGGAYTSIPFVQIETVLKGGWLPQSIFIDCIVISNVLPAPLVIFATFVGFQGGLMDGGLGSEFIGAAVATLGMFSPCFVFTIIGHNLLEKLVRNQFLSDFFDGLCGVVVGVVAIIAAILYILALAVLYKFTRDRGLVSIWEALSNTALSSVTGAKHSALVWASGTRGE